MSANQDIDCIPPGARICGHRARCGHQSEYTAAVRSLLVSAIVIVLACACAGSPDSDSARDSTPTPVPTATPAVSPDVPASVDGLWSAERNLAISGITLTEQATGRRFDLPDTDAYQWAPAGHLMATGGGWCGGGRVSIIDPDAGSIIPVTPGGPDGHGVMYVWRPDGRALALDLLGMSHSLVLVDPITGEMTPLIAPPENVGEFVPLAWNPRGTHLLLRVQGGRDCSD